MWREIQVGSDTYLICSELVDDKWKIMLTNLIELWCETISREEIIDECQVLNPLLSIEDVDIDEIMRQILSDIPELAVEATTKKIKLETTIDDGIFKFEINFSKTSPQELWQELTMPLCLSVGELRRQNELLVKEIKRKDEEILEYRLSGAELIRKHIQTKPFKVDSLRGTAAGQDANCISIFQSAMNSSEILKDKRKVKTEEASTNNHDIAKPSTKEERHTKNGRKRRKTDKQTKIVEPEAEVLNKTSIVKSDQSTLPSTSNKK